jgi:Zn-finger nucleic acid-binding protein
MNIRTTSLNCQKCGGALACIDNHHAYRCEYCCQLSIVSDTPLLVDGIQPVDEQVKSECPTCFGWLQTAQLDGRPILYCNSCYGMLVRRDHFGAIVNERRSKRSDREQEVCRPLDPKALSRRLRCPACADYMEAHPYYGPGNVMIDSCAECGYVWLDHGELSSVERAAGGREPVNMHLPVDTAEFSGSNPTEECAPRHPIALLADFLF